MANLKVSENPLPFLPFTDTADPAAPAAGVKRIWVDTDDKLKMIDESSVVTEFNTGTTPTDATLAFTDVTTNNSSTSKHGFLKKLDNSATHFMDGTGNWSTPTGTGAVASDTIWDAAGDLAVGSGADTAARLAKGAAGANLSTYNGVVAWNGGTSFPASPTTGDRYWRSDLGRECYYDGTRWLGTQLYHHTSNHQNPGATSTYSGPSQTQGQFNLPVPALDSASDIWLVGLNTQFFINGGTALSGSHQWVMIFQKVVTNNTGTTLITITINSGSSSVWRTDNQAIGALLNNGTTHFVFATSVTKTGTPGPIFAHVDLSYRFVYT